MLTIRSIASSLESGTGSKNESASKTEGGLRAALFFVGRLVNITEKGSDPIIHAKCENNWIRPLFRQGPPTGSTVRGPVPIRRNAGLMDPPAHRWAVPVPVP